MAAIVLALDQGTTSTRAIAFRVPDLLPLAIAQRELPQHFPAPGMVEHDPEDIWHDSVAVMRRAAADAGATPADIAAIGLTNQRETTLLWDRRTGAPLHRAVVWQDRRTADACDALLAAGHGDEIAARTGLVVDPYFSATKLTWMLDQVPGARERAARGEVAFGTVDTFLLWRLTGGSVHATDATNASRTMLVDIRRGAWDDDLLALFRVPRAVLPQIRDSAGDFGVTTPEILGAPVRLLGVAGDQQAAAIGQACFRPGMVKATYGTGAFMLMNTGEAPVPSRHRLLTTIAWQFGGKRSYALEGAIFVAGAAVQWLRDALGLLREAADAGRLAENAADEPVYFVPAFTGLGAPYWDSRARGALFGLTRATGPAELARAALESVAYQTRDLLEAMGRDQAGTGETVLRVDGGMAVSDWTMQFLADLLGAPVDRPAYSETTAIGAAYLAGLAAGVCPEPAAFAAGWRLGRRFLPSLEPALRERKYAGWKDAVRRTLA